MTAEELLALVTGTLEELKAVKTRVLDVHGLTSIMDTMIVTSGSSDRHVRSIAGRLVEAAKAKGWQPLGVEGEREGEWVLVDLGDIVVHVMLPRVRDFYQLEKLWDMGPAREPAEGSRD